MWEVSDKRGFCGCMRVVFEVDGKRLHWKQVNLGCCSWETVPSHYFIVFLNDLVYVVFMSTKGNLDTYMERKV